MRDDQVGRQRSGEILIVDDDEQIREAIGDILRDQGYSVGFAANGQQALDRCRSAPIPDLILLDLQMPVMNGAEFARVKNSDAALSKVPVCVITAFSASVSIPEGTSLVLRKPLGSTDLLTVAKRFCPAS